MSNETKAAHTRTDTSYINIVAWGELAQLLAAGRPRDSQARLRAGRWADYPSTGLRRPDGTKVSYTQIILSEVQPLDRSNDKRYSGSGTAGGNTFKHYSQTTIADRYTEKGLGEDDEDANESTLQRRGRRIAKHRRLAEIARQTRWEEEISG